MKGGLNSLGCRGVAFPLCGMTRCGRRAERKCGFVYGICWCNVCKRGNLKAVVSIFHLNDEFRLFCSLEVYSLVLLCRRHASGLR